MTTPREIKIDPLADRDAVLDALLQALDMLDPEAGTRAAMAGVLRGYLSGELSQARLLDALLQSAQRGCQQAAGIGTVLARAQVMMPEGVADAVNVGVAQSFMDLAFILCAAAVMHRSEPVFIQTAEAALRPLQAVAAQMGATELLNAMDIMFQRAAAAAPPPTDELGRNRPCRCGSGKKFKLCCGVLA